MPTSGAETASSTGRLVRTADYAHVQGKGRRHRGRLFLLVVAPGSAATSRVGFAVSRKVGNAVIRNRVKRWIREGVRKVPGPRGGIWDLVFVARPEAADAGLFAVLDDMDTLFRRLDARA